MFARVLFTTATAVALAEPAPPAVTAPAAPTSCTRSVSFAVARIVTAPLPAALDASELLILAPCVTYASTVFRTVLLAVPPPRPTATPVNPPAKETAAATPTADTDEVSVAVIDRL